MEKRQIFVLAVLRQRVGLTQIDLALAIGKSQTEISHWEKGDRPIPAGKAGEVLAVLRAKDRHVIPLDLKAADLSRPWDDVIMEMRSKDIPLRAPAGRAAAKARA